MIFTRMPGESYGRRLGSLLCASFERELPPVVG